MTQKRPLLMLMMALFLALTAALSAILLSTNSLLAAGDPQEPPPTDTEIHLKTGSFDPLHDEEVVQAAAVDAPATPYRLVQFVGPVQQSWVQQVEALGGRVLGYIPNNAHIVYIADADLAKIRSLPTVRWIGAYQPTYKVAPALTAQVTAADADAALELIVVAFPGESVNDLRTFLQAQGATVLEEAVTAGGPVFRITAPASTLSAVSQYAGVSWVERYLEPQLFNAEGRKIIGAENVWQNSGFFGANQIIAISDSGLSVQGDLSNDFEGRLLRAFSPSEMNLASAQCSAKTDWTDLNGHGTHVAGSVLGNGALSGSDAATHQYTTSHAGTAPEARLVFMALNTDGSGGIQCVDLNGDFLAKGYDEGARISSNSWGANDGGAYGRTSQIVDDYIWRHKDYLVLYANGNSGPGPGTVGSPATAKNVLSIGASENNRPDQGAISDDPSTVTDFSSRGPTDDGRIKPDVVAPGSSVLSVRAAQAPAGNFQDIFNENYAFNSGTSMATPLAAGAAALVREWLGKVRGVTNPSAALLKALIINGATQLPGQTAINNVSGRGRFDLKNILSAQYAIMDDHVQGLTTGDTISYTVRVISSTQAGLVYAALTPPDPDAQMVQAAAFDSMHVTGAAPPSGASAAADAAQWSAEGLPGFAAARNIDPITTSSAYVKSDAAPLSNTAPVTLSAGAAGPSIHFTAVDAAANSGERSYQQNMVYGGDFEDPGWTDQWSQLWLGSGVPARTSDVDKVINGVYSMWLGGTPLDDALYYPIQFPNEIDAQFDSGITFYVAIQDQDIGEDGTIFDRVCVELIDISGNAIGPFAEIGPDCAEEDGLYKYTLVFNESDKGSLAGQTAYLAIYTTGDAAEPHMSAFVDDIVLPVDFPDVTATAIPQSGPAGTTFLITGQYNVPYGWVDLCINPCSTENYISTVYADARGDINAYLHSSDTITPGTYDIQTYNIADRTANVALTITGDSNPSLTVSPPLGPAGTTFQVTGLDFLPNDNNIQALIDGAAAGTVGSNAQGQVGVTIETSSNTPAGEYALELVDSAQRAASVNFTVTAISAGEPTMSVTPASGPPGSQFLFSAANFDPTSTADIVLDGQLLGRLDTKADGSLAIQLQTKETILPGAYTLEVIQGAKQASARFEITSAGGGGGGETPATGNGIYVALVWTDPPAQSAAATALVNDLDLIVDGPDGRIFGNGGAAPDDLDNVETVRIETPSVGSYVVTVRATRVSATFGAQPYALVATTAQNFETNSGSADLGSEAKGSLAGVVFVDLNGNGAREAGEAGIVGAIIRLEQVNGSVSQQTESDANGAYVFNALPFDAYTVSVSLPAGYGFTTPQTFTQELSVGGAEALAVGAVHRLFVPVVMK
ncbi:MAG: S8 family serine peptidase [Caldilineaceae bacterium]